MYDLYYRFTAEPFRLSPDHHFAFQHRGYKKARSYMAYAFMRAEGFVLVTDRPGEKVTTANIVCSQLEASDLLQMVAYEFGVDVAHTEKGVLLQHLSRLLQKWHREGRRALLIVDEAQDLSVSAMEELRLLTNIQAGGKPLLQIFLLGQPDLRELILSPQLEQVHQRIVAASHLEALELDETEAYVRHRLTLVGWRGDPDISRSIYPLIYKFSEGVPRRINLICSRLLLHGSVEQLHRLGVADIKEVLGELQGESLAAGNQLVDNDFQVDDVFEVSRTAAAEVPAAGFSAAHPLRDVSGRGAAGQAEDSTEPSEEPEPGRVAEESRATGSDDFTAVPSPHDEGVSGRNEGGSVWRRRMRRNNRIF